MIDGQVISSRCFSLDDQRRFGSFSGDVNPMHLDPIFSRRTQAGAPVVHGIHAALWAIGALKSLLHGQSPTSLKVNFSKFIYLGSEVYLTARRRDSSKVEAELKVGRLSVGHLKLDTGAIRRTEPQRSGYMQANSKLLEPRPLSFNDLKNLTGAVPLPEVRDCKLLFRDACDVLSPQAVQSLSALSTVVGMECPGLHSVFSEVNVCFFDTGCENQLRYDVITTDDGFRHVQMRTTGPFLHGTISAFMRPPPTDQMSTASIKASVNPDEFSKINAIIVGGSRGLGALTAKIIAAGGGSPIITYNTGRDDAALLVDEINRETEQRRCTAIRYDVNRDPTVQLVAVNRPINQAYYFATPRILKHSSELFDRELYQRFTDVYVEGFYLFCSALKTYSSSLTVFYPSSIYVVDRPKDMTEYCMAKAAGEILAADIGRFWKNFKVKRERLPRLLTDQTATIVPVSTDDPLSVMLPIIREMNF